jgi:hypothetical protein
MRFMFWTRLAKPILVVARARPMVRMKRPIGPFCWAKTCSTAARTLDFRPLARAVCRGIGFALRLLAVYLRTQGMVHKVLLIGGGTVGGVSPDIAGGVVLVDQFRQQRAVVTGGIGDSPATDQPMPAVDAKMFL